MTKLKENTSSFDKVKWVAIAFLVVAGFVANFYFSDQPTPIRLLGWLVLLCVIFVVALQTAKGQQGWQFFQSTRAELRKVVWPTRQETVQTTLIVIAMVALMSLILWGVDSFLLWLVSLLTGQRG